MDYYEFQLGDEVKIVNNKLFNYGNNSKKLAPEVLNQNGILVGFGKEKPIDIDALTYMVLSMFAFNSTIPSRFTVYVVELKNGDMINLDYSNLVLVEPYIDKRNRLMNQLTDIMVKMELELSKSMTKYRIAKLKELNKERNYIIAELSDDEMLECAKFNAKLILERV